MKKLGVGKDIAYIALFTALSVVCAWICIPTPVPFTLQTFALFAAVCMLGAKKGFLVACAYLAIGFVGVPVFSGFQGGFSALFGATGGYLIGYFVGGALMCLVELIPVKRCKKALVLSVGLLTYYVCGVLWYTLVFVQGAVGFFSALLICVVPFLVPDVAKMVLAIYLSKKLSHLAPRIQKTSRPKNAVYALDARTLTDEVFACWYEKMPHARRQKIDALQFEKDKRLSLAASVLLYSVTKSYGISLSDIQTTEKGKPYCDKEKFFFSLSHSGDYAVLAVSQKEVGIDLEKVREFSPPLIDKAFTDREKVYAKEENQDFRYTQIWTRKESVGKYLGTGLSAPKKIEIDKDGVRSDRADVKKLRFTVYELDGYALTVCATRKPFSKGICWLSVTQEN